MNQEFSKQRISYVILASIILGLTLCLALLTPFVFQRFFSHVHPLIVIGATVLLGYLLLFILNLKLGFNIYKKENVKRAIGYFWLVLIFTFIAIGVDLLIIFPKDMNLGYPTSLMFYPVIAFFVEMAFHVLPFALLLFILSSILKNINAKTLIWFCILIIALLEPTYQIVYSESQPTWSLIIVWLNLYAFNIFQLIIYKRFDFIAMYVSRLIYYAIWHVAWGEIRLEVLY